MQRHLLMGSMIAGLLATSSIFGQRNMLTEQATTERQQRTMKRRVARAYKYSSHTPHQGKQEIERRLARGFGQYPEYTALRARNIASGKWPASTPA